MCYLAKAEKFIGILERGNGLYPAFFGSAAEV